MANCGFSAIDNIAENRDLANLSLTPANENPGASDNATGAMSIDLAITQKDYRKPGRNAMSLYAKDRHKRAARMLGFALTDGTPDTWADTGLVWAVRLTTNELASIAYTALRALEPEAREMTFNAAHWGSVQ